MIDCRDQNNKCVSFNFSMINSIFLALRMWGGNQNYSLPVLPSGQRDPIVPLSREFRSFMRRSLRHTKIKFSWYEIVHICMKPFFEEKSISYSKDQKSAYICWFCQVVLSGNHHSSAKALLSYFLSDGIKATEPVPLRKTSRYRRKKYLFRSNNKMEFIPNWCWRWKSYEDAFWQWIIWSVQERDVKKLAARNATAFLKT